MFLVAKGFQINYWIEVGVIKLYESFDEIKVRLNLSRFFEGLPSAFKQTELLWPE